MKHITRIIFDMENKEHKIEYSDKTSLLIAAFKIEVQGKIGEFVYSRGGEKISQRRKAVDIFLETHDKDAVF